MSETSPRVARWIRPGRGGIAVLTAATAVSVLVVLLVLAAWRNDHLIESDKGVTTAEVLSAGRLRSAVMYVTPDGVTHNPKVGVLYPTNLTAGQSINVEYYRADPDLVRVAGRDVRVALVPAASVLVVVWAIALPALWLLHRRRRDTGEPPPGAAPDATGTAAAAPAPAAPAPNDTAPAANATAPAANAKAPTGEVAGNRR